MQQLNPNQRQLLQSVGQHAVSYRRPDGTIAATTIGALKNWTPCSGRSPKFNDDSRTFLATKIGKSVVTVSSDGGIISGTPADYDMVVTALEKGEILDQDAGNN